jgi:hypothetical protein
VVCTPGPLQLSSRGLGRRLAPPCALGALLGALIASPARAQAPRDDAAAPAATTEPASPAAPPTETDAARLAEQLRALGKRVESDARVFGSIELGRGLRFNNPYRLATELGKDAQSVSLTPSYIDLGLAAAIGAPDGLQHGGSLHASIGLAGVRQLTLTPAYLMAYRGPRSFLAYGRLGPSIIVTPDPTIGGEVAAGFAWFLTGKIAIASEVVFDLYYGAGTHDVGVATYPILSGQLGLLIDHELLP